MKDSNSKYPSHIIFGLGTSGLSCARYFDRIKQNYYLVDSRTRPPGESEVQALTCCDGFMFGDIDETLLEQCSMLVVSPGVALTTPLIVKALAMGIDVCGDVELFARNCKKSIVAITGSNGKSTVTDLTEKLINSTKVNAQMGGNIGLPVLDFLPEDKADVYILELSSFQLDSTFSLKADVAVILNISEDHMDRYDSFNAYVASKQSIYNGAKSKIFNGDDERTYPSNIAANDVSFSKHQSQSEQINNSSYLNKSKIGYQLVVNNNAFITTEQLKIAGTHNWLNALVSLSILEQLNFQIDTNVLKTLCSYSGLKHRFELVSKKRGCFWINDSKATNVGATIAALNSLELFEGKTYLIAGGDSKNANLSELKDCFESKVDCLILLGKDAKKIGSVTNKVHTCYVETLSQAVIKVTQLVESGDVILLSPACASLDMFRNFEQRGQAFVEAVEVCA